MEWSFIKNQLVWGKERGNRSPSIDIELNVAAKKINSSESQKEV